MDIQKTLFFRGLEKDELERVKRETKKRIYPKRSIVFVSGQEADGLYIIYKGRVKVFILYPDGREKTLAILREGETLGEVTLYGNELRSATVETLETTTFLIISRESFQSLISSIPRLSMRVIELLSRRLRQANRQIEELTFLNARSRVICTLLHLAEEHGCKVGQEVQIFFSLTHAELAKLVGVSRETVTKVLNELREKGLIRINRGHIEIIHASNLQNQVM